MTGTEIVTAVLRRKEAVAGTATGGVTTTIGTGGGGLVPIPETGTGIEIGTAGIIEIAAEAG